MKKKLIHHSTIETVLFVFALAVLFPIMAEASAAHTREESVNWAIAQIGKGLDYDHMYGNQCVDLIKYYYDYLGHGGYAKGNAYEYKTNALPPGWVRVYGDYQPGDVAVWKTNHVAIITSADSVGFNAVNQNYNETPYCTQNWFKLSVLECAIRPDFPAPNLITLWVIEEGKQVNGIVRLWAKRSDSDPNHYAVFEMDGEPITGHISADNNGYFSVEIDTRRYSNGNHRFSISYANTNGGYHDSRTIVVNNPADTQPPSLSNLRVSDITADGYTVSCTVTDNVGVARVRFPSWNSDIHQGWDAVWLDGTINGNTASVRVNIADLKSGAMEGNYMTHIYAYDFAGNSSSIYMNDNKKSLFIDRTPPVVSGAYIERDGKDGYWVWCKVTDNLEDNIDRVQFPTWTVENWQDDLVTDWRTNPILKGRKEAGDYYRIYVDVKNHNNEMGSYRNHIYAFDKYGNLGKYNDLPDVEFMEEDMPPVILGKQVSYPNANTAHIKITAEDNVGLGEMYGRIVGDSGRQERFMPVDGVYEFDYELKSGYVAVFSSSIYDKGGNQTDFKILLGEPGKEVTLKAGGKGYPIEDVRKIYPEVG